jgi:hypothetical protein
VIILIITSLASESFLGPIVGRIIILAFVLLLLDVFIPELKGTGKKSAEKFNFRETDSDDNSMNC